jgi:prefoldin beta subunit
MVEKVPAEMLKAKYKKFEELRAELAKLAQAKATSLRSLEETRTVLEEIKTLPDDTKLFKLVGFVLVPVTKKDLVEELEKRVKDLEARISKLEKLEEEHRQELDRLLGEIQKLASGQGGAALGG